MKDSVLFQPPHINVSTIKVMLGKDRKSIMSNLMSYLWIRSHYRFPMKFKDFIKFEKFDIYGTGIGGTIRMTHSLDGHEGKYIYGIRGFSPRFEKID